MQSSIKPNFYANFPSVMPRESEEQVTIEDITDSEKQLAALGNSKNWETFRDVAHSLLGEMDSIGESGLAKGLTFEEIGRNTVVVNLAKGIVTRLLNKVEDAKETINNAESRGQTK